MIDIPILKFVIDRIRKNEEGHRQHCAEVERRLKAKELHDRNLLDLAKKDLVERHILSADILNKE